MIISKISLVIKTNLKLLLRHFVRNYCLKSPPPKEPVVTILEASSEVGRNLALLLKQSPLIGELRLYDKNANICGLAEDLSHIDTKTKVKSFGAPSVLKYAIMDADVVLSIGGCRKSYKENLQETFERNVDDVRNAALHLIEFNPKAILCIAKPPIEAFVPLVSEEYKKGGVYDSRKIIGITTVSSMRTNSQIATFSGQNPTEVVCPILGGPSADCIVPVLSQSRPKGPGLPKTLHKIISNSENDVLKLYADCQTVSVMPALGIFRFVNTLLKALNGETNCVDCAFVRQNGHIGQFMPYMASIVRFGRAGVLSCHMPNISGEEAHYLKKVALVLKQYISLGEEFATGKSSFTDEKASLSSADKQPHIIQADPNKPVLKST